MYSLTAELWFRGAVRMWLLEKLRYKLRYATTCGKFAIRYRILSMQHTVKVHWWYWGYYALNVLYDLLMAVFYTIAGTLTLGILFGLVYYLQLVAQ